MPKVLDMSSLPNLVLTPHTVQSDFSYTLQIVQENFAQNIGCNLFLCESAAPASQVVHYSYS